ncbi:MAG: preprotein translocase subunit SecG [Ruminococcaceae bacterium]|nr:preprotein translocase subunit SecG [Oscillospiraceae bacterium]
MPAIVKTILIIAEIIVSVALIAVVTLQSGKEAGMGALTGKSDSYLSKSKFGTMDKILAAATKWIALVWILLTLSLSMVG